MNKNDPDDYQNLLDKLRNAHLSLKEYVARCQTDLKTPGFIPDVILLEDPEKQKGYRTEYINNISEIPQPNKLYLDAHELQRRCMETIANKADPTDVKEELANFFKRRASNLQHKKYKLLIRWAHYVQGSESIDTVGLRLDPLFAKVQTEYDLAIERADRLCLDDGFHDFYKVKKPHPTATEGKHSGKPLYIESEERLPSSSLRQDDVEVYLRSKTFRNQIFRIPNKLISLMKWMKYTNRYEILGESRRSMIKLRNENRKKQRDLCTLVSDTLREKLVRAGIDTEKVVTAVVDTYTKSLRDKEYPSKAEELLSTTKYDYVKLPLLHTLAIELKFCLKEISAEFDITGDLEVDNGHSFTYQIQVHFPVLFQKHVENSKFDLYDTFPEDEDGALRNKNPKNNQLENLHSYAKSETKKSMLGYINTDDLPQITGDISKDTVIQTESYTKLRGSYWLPYICFTPRIDSFYKKQSLLFQVKGDSLLSSYFDFLDVNDCSAVNKILDDASILHTQRAQKRNPLRTEGGKFVSVEKELEQNLSLAANKESGKKLIDFEIEPLIEPIPVHIVKGLYMLRYLKARDFKSKLLNAMNYYREIQKRLTCDMVEMGSRDRLNLNCNIVSPKDIANNAKKLLKNTMINDLLLEALEAESEIDHFVSIKAFKHKKMFKPKVTATSPSLPKIHIAFEGFAGHYSVSEEEDDINSGEMPSEQAKRLRGRICKREFNKDYNDVKIIDEEGIPIIYDTALHDIVSLEKELIQIGTFYIKKQEYLIDVEIREPMASIDRGAVSAELLEYENKFQYAKIRLIEELMESYENTVDILEQQRFVQIIIDIMAKRPRLNTDATHFIDSYKSEIEYLTNMREFLNELARMQIKKEKEIANDIREYLELKYRKVNEHINRKWEYTNPDKIDKEENKNTAKSRQHETENEENEREEREKNQRLANIAKRHITDFTKNYDQDFTEVLGLPEITADDLFKKNREKEPIVIDALRQQSQFIKIEEGYPHFPEKEELLNFYESVGCITRIYSLVDTIFQECIEIHKPENGQAISALHGSITRFSRSKLKLAKNVIYDKDVMTEEEKTLVNLQDGFLCDFPDKMVLLAKEMKSYSSNEKAENIDPFIAGHCDLDTIENFEFIDAKQLEEDPFLDENVTLDTLIKKGMQISQAATKFQSKIRQEEKVKASAKNEEEKQKKLNKLRFKVQMPSLLYFYCNIVEVLRLRENLIKTLTDTICLSGYYKQLCKYAGSEFERIQFSECLGFDTSGITKGKKNFVDTGKGDALDHSLVIREFDPTLLSNLNFAHGQSFKLLITELGVEELRGVLHYQVMQHQILMIAIEKNQTILESVLKGISELDYLSSKDDLEFILPNSHCKMNHVLSKSVEGYNLDILNKEKMRLKNNFKKECSEHFAPVLAPKSKQRSSISKKYQIFVNKLTTSDYKIEGKLRILRNYRIKLLHQLCRDILKNAYQETLRTQLLKICNDLRIKSNLLPFKKKKELILFCGLCDYQEDIPRAMAKNNILHQDPVYNIENYEEGNFKTLFYVPNTVEVCYLENKIPPEFSSQGQFPTGIAEKVDENNLEKPIREVMVPKPTKKKFTDFKYLNESAKGGIIEANFAEAYSYGGKVFDLLVYLTLVNNIFDLEYSICKLNSSGEDILNLESQIFSGQVFWKDEKALYEPQFGVEEGSDEEKDHDFPIPTETISDKLIRQIVKEKREKKHLADDMENIKNNFKKIGQLVKNPDNKNLQKATNILINHHQMFYYIFLHGMERAQDKYLEKGEHTEFRLLQDYLNNFTNKYEGIITRDNGYHINQALITPSGCDIEQEFYTDYEDFNKAYQPVVDEKYLIPSHIRLVHQIYGEKSLNNLRRSQYNSHFPESGYPCLKWCFLNLNDIERVCNYTTYKSVRDELEEYGKLTEINELGDEAIFEAQLAYLKNKIQSRQLRHAFMCFEGKCTMPESIEGYKALSTFYKEGFYFKVIFEKDKVLESYKKKKIASMEFKSSHGDGDEISKERIEQLKQIAASKGLVHSSYSLQSNEFIIDVRRNEPAIIAKAEISCIQREFDVILIKESIKLISKHDEALKGCLEMGAADNQINAFIHPYQQFASTLFETVDRNSHLDIVTKASFVQQFLTRLRNRCTEVETLTSGPGIVFSMKDFNDCVQTLCRGMIKYCETTVRSMSETNSLKTQQLSHLVYVNERQRDYYKRKCKNFVEEIDKIINAKMTEKGAAIIYELDITHRELRMLKDNYYLMEKMMREEINKQFIDEITEKDYLLKKYKEGFDEYKVRVNKGISSEVYNEITTIENRVKARANVYKMTDIQGIEDKIKRLQEAERQKGIPGLQSIDREVKLPQDDESNFSPSFDNYRPDNGDADDTNYGAYEPYMPSAREELLQLHRALRNQKNFMRIKEVMMKEKHEREIFNLKQQLTSNQALWEQLAESEKREAIMRQELFFTQQSLATCEKIISKMQSELEVLQNQRLRLQQYKNNKSKRLDELESKVRQMEILENIDLNKLLDELRARDRKLTQLTKVEKNLQGKIDSVYKIGEQKVEEMRHKFLQEKKIKESAFARLDGLRMEIRAIEGQDIGDDIWKEKCKELFSLCKELQKENEELRNTRANELNNIATPDIGSLRENIESMASHTHDDKSFKNAYMDRMGAKTITTKPSTAAQKHRLLAKKKGYMSGGSLAGALGINQTEMSPRGSTNSSAVKGIYSTTNNAKEYDRKRPHYSVGRFGRKAPQSQGNNARQRTQKRIVKKAVSKQRNPFEYNPRPHMKSEESSGGVFTLPGVYNSSDNYIKGVKAPNQAKIIGSRIKPQ